MDLDAYFRRIGYEGGTDPSIRTLRELHFAHRCAVPFENLDIHLGLPISLNILDLEQKIVARRRGGYCFEQNTLFLHVLRQLGFEARPREARVGPTDGPVRPRTHMTIDVSAEGVPYHVDVGFGKSHLYPVRLDGEIHAEHDQQFRVVPGKGSTRVLQSLRDQAWVDSYAIQASDPSPIDFDLANWYASTHPDSRFRRTPTAQIQAPEKTFILRGRTYTSELGGVEEVRELANEEIPSLLHEVFGLDLGAATSRIDFDGPAPPIRGME